MLAWAVLPRAQRVAARLLAGWPQDVLGHPLFAVGLANRCLRSRFASFLRSLLAQELDARVAGFGP